MKKAVAYSLEAEGHSVAVPQWKEQDDPRWFGASSRGDFASAENIHSSFISSAPVSNGIVGDGSADDTPDPFTIENRMRFIEPV